MNEESRVLAAIHTLHEMLADIPVLRIDVKNLKDDVSNLKKSDQNQNRYMYVAAGVLLTLGFLAKYGPGIINFFSK